MKQSAAAAIAACVLSVATARPAPATHTGGLAWPLGQGGFATSITLAYVDQALQDGEADGASSFRNLLRVEFGLLEDLDLFGTAGISDLKLQGQDFDESRGGSIAGGVRYGLITSSDRSLRLVMSAEGEYFKISDVARVEYNAGVYLAKQYGAAGKIGFFYPYGGARVSYSTYQGEHGIDDYKGKKFIGLLGGADYFVSPNVYFSGEIHLFDEMSLYVTTGYRF